MRALAGGTLTVAALATQAFLEAGRSAVHAGLATRGHDLVGVWFRAGRHKGWVSVDSDASRGNPTS